MQDSRTPIGWVWSSFEETSTLQMLDDGTHRARRNSQEVCDRLLCLSGVVLDGVENREVPWLKSEGTYDLTELTRRLQTDLRQSESHRVV